MKGSRSEARKPYNFDRNFKKNVLFKKEQLLTNEKTMRKFEPIKCTRIVESYRAFWTLTATLTVWWDFSFKPLSASWWAEPRSSAQKPKYTVCPRRIRTLIVLWGSGFSWDTLYTYSTLCLYTYTTCCYYLEYLYSKWNPVMRILNFSSDPPPRFWKYACFRLIVTY